MCAHTLAGITEPAAWGNTPHGTCEAQLRMRRGMRAPHHHRGSVPTARTTGIVSGNTVIAVMIVVPNSVNVVVGSSDTVIVLGMLVGRMCCIVVRIKNAVMSVVVFVLVVVVAPRVMASMVLPQRLALRLAALPPSEHVTHMRIAPTSITDAKHIVSNTNIMNGTPVVIVVRILMVAR